MTRGWYGALLCTGLCTLSCSLDSDDTVDDPGESPGVDAESPLGGVQADPQPPAAPPTPKSGCGLASAPSPSTCCPTGYTQLTGDVNANTWLKATWDRVNYCVFAYAAADSVALGTGSDLVYGGDDADFLHGQGGDDRIEAGNGNDTVRGGPGGDLLYGQAGDDVINGDAGNDTIYGGTNADTIRPGAGLDSSYGEDGNDVFIIGSACEVVSGEVINGGNGTDKIQSPLSQSQLMALGVTFTSIETFETIAYEHSECLVVGQTMGALSVVKPIEGRLVTFAPRNDGTVLAKNPEEVFSVSSLGTLTALQAGDRVYISPTGHSFAVQDQEDGELAVYNGSGVLQGTLTGVAPRSFFKLLPTSDHIFAPDVTVVGHEDIAVNSARILELDGTVRATIATPGLSAPYLTATHLIYTTDTTLRKLDLDGVEDWEVTRSIYDLAVSDGATSSFIAQLQHDTGHVHHFVEDGAATSTAVDGVVWDVAMAPGGGFSAAIVHKSATVGPRLYIFAAGVLQFALELPVKYANSLAVTDQGEVFVGAQSATRIGTILAYNDNGNLLWQQTTTDEKNGFRPLVVPSPDGNFLLAGQTRGLHAYAINRSPTP